MHEIFSSYFDVLIKLVGL